MKQLTKSFGVKAMITTAMLCFYSIVSWAQENTVTIDKQEVESWFSQNWMWVVGGVVVLILLIALFSRERRISRNGTRKTTTVVKDDLGRTQSVTTTEEPIKLS